MTKLVFGCGYLGRKVADAYLKQGDQVTGLVRSSDSAEVLKSAGISALEADLDNPPVPQLPLQGAQLFYFAPPPGEGVADTRVNTFIEACSQQGDPDRIVYLSTTGVYGDCNGEWVDESRPVKPVADRAKRRWDAEEQFRCWSRNSGKELVILRVSGIYGPGRLPLARLRKGLPMIREEEAPFTNRIHIHDLVAVCIAAMERGRSGELYNVSDGHPGTMTDYFNRIADLASLPRPSQISFQEGEGALSAGMMSYMRESRRLDNRKMLNDLGVVLRYPDLETGLPCSLLT